MRVEMGPYVPNSIKKRKIQIKIHHYDAWDVGGTLYPIIYKLLKEYKKQLKIIQCFPCETTYEEWLIIVDKMLFTFKDLDSITFGEGGTVEEHIIKIKKVDEGLELFGKYFRHLWI